MSFKQQMVWSISASSVLLIVLSVFLVRFYYSHETVVVVPEYTGSDFMTNSFDEERMEVEKEYYFDTVDKIDDSEKETNVDFTSKQPLIKETDIAESKLIEEVTEEEPEHDITDFSYWCSWGEFRICPEEYDVICKTVELEVGTESAETRYMVALTLLNRVNSEYFPNTIIDVVFQEEQYAVTQLPNFWSTQPSQATIDAVDRALAENSYDEELFYFRTSHYHSFGRPLTSIGNVYFSTQD